MLPLLPCFKVLPLVYDESLSYYEVLCKLTKLIQEMAKKYFGGTYLPEAKDIKE